LRIRQHLENLPQRLLDLNPSRREAICHYLDFLAGSAPIAPNAGRPALNATERLRTWIDWRHLSPSHQRALAVFFEEVGLIQLAQAILLKAWSDRGIRKWKRDDLLDLNSALHLALRPQVPMDRDGWQVTRPNLYSWFKLPHELQESLWAEFSSWRILDEGPDLLIGLIESTRQTWPERARASGFDERLYTALWNHTPDSGSPSILTPRKRSGFSPTLRDGALVRSGPSQCSWFGYESNAFSLFIGELSLLWWGPSAPACWSVGSGLEVPLTSQLSLNIPTTGKPLVGQRIQEMEACDIAWVQEEAVIRGHHRSIEAQTFREAADSNPALKRLRTGGTSCGHLQACVSMTKLRPGGLLWWLRQEPLHASDGSEALQFLLDRGKLVAEWDFSGLTLGFPQNSPKPVLPRYLYLFERETDVQKKLDHHPRRVWIRGQLKSQIEIQPLLEESLKTLNFDSEGLSKSVSEDSKAPKKSWQILVQQHPLPQREWADHWPETSENQELEEVQELKRHSQPLASFANIRRGIAIASPSAPASAPWPARKPSPRGFVIRPHFDGKTRSLKTEGLPAPGSIRSNASALVQDTDCFTLFVADEALVAPLRFFLESELVRTWLDHKAARKNHRWVLKEQDLRILPIPERLLDEASPNPKSLEASFALPLPGKWEKLAADLAIAPQKVREELQRLETEGRDHPLDTSGGKTSIRIRSAVYVRASRVLQDLKAAQAQMAHFILPEGKILWKELIGTLSPQDFVPISVHPLLTIRGQMPLQTPITHLSTVKAPQGILMATEAGHQLGLEIPNRLLMEILWDQIQALDRPTWSEIVEYVRAPRRLETLEARAADLLRIQGEHQNLIQHLSGILLDTLPALIEAQ
jgi:hypothetical protein